MSIPDILGWLGNVGFFLGAILLAQKKVSGFWWQIEGNLFYLVQAFILGMTSLIACSAILIFINICGILNWEYLKRSKNECKR